RDPQLSDAALTVVTTGVGDAHFALEHGVVVAGAWQYQLEQRGQDWVLAQKHDEDEKPLPTPSAAKVTALFNAETIACYSE
ncbi:autotransporter outer membrane beta-barrel domain-containing protein, partial [Pantoea dispersa]|uniref:autotransporter outer membrane beta-barrel domain-containing protein n=1 Tax=Pantoea dispersa TaxID=59814 RepID=UPI0021B07887